jgi:transposase-like protein
MANASLDDRHQGGAYRRIELITGAPRRRRWSAEEKARILAESFEPGARVSDVALRHGVNRGLVWSWRRQAGKHEIKGAHSGDLERSIRSIMNTDSGDHEHPLALA